MAVAMVYPAPEKGGRGKKKTVDETSTLFGSKRLQLARTVLVSRTRQFDGREIEIIDGLPD
jgi:hypothetical protein